MQYLIKVAEITKLAGMYICFSIFLKSLMKKAEELADRLEAYEQKLNNGGKE